MEIDLDNAFHASCMEGKERQLMFAQPLMDVDMSLSQKLHKTNVVEGISMLQNDYAKCGHSLKRCDMSDSEGSNHSSSQSAKQIISES